MRFLLLVFSICIYSLSAFSQQNTIRLKSGDFLLDQKFDMDNLEIDRYRLMFFDHLPNDLERSEMEGLGISFLDYLPRNIYVVSLQNVISNALLDKYNVNSINRILGSYKIHPKIQNNEYPSWALKNGDLFLNLVFYKDVIMSDKIEYLRRFCTIEDINSFSNIVLVSCDPKNLYFLLDLEYIFFIEPIDPPSLPENHEGRTLHRSNIINTSFATGRHYDGSGISIMMQDDGIIGPHIDYMGRVDQSNCGGCSTNNSNDHGDHVAGTIMGSGNLDPKGRGMADGSFLYVYSSSNNNYYDVPNLYQNNNVTITSKSYSNGCNAGYTSLSKDLDEQINIYTSLMHVFSAGNNGSSDCGYGAGSGWGNVTGGHKQAKNVIAVANLNGVGNLASSSSRGPAADGRIKPDIASKGTSVYSTIPAFDYDYFTGTSMACPGIAGVMAQLYQAFKELNNGQNPNSALMKCILLNSADDIGNPGPDFKHGWGEVNAYRAVKILESGQYFNSTISQSAMNSHSITIPSGIDQVKVMTYWNDKEASTSASISLVNDINTSINFLPLGIIYDPLVLDESPNQTSLNSYAVPGVDDLNNMEQIIIDNPIPGTYMLNIDGFSIPFGPQEYWVTFEFIDDQVDLTYPIGGEGFVPSESEIIRWDASKGSAPFVLEYTTDGIVWNLISNSVNSDDRYYTWSVPNIVTDKAKIRVSRGSSVSESVESFTIVDVPQNIIVDWLCPDSIYMYWDPVSGADSYEVSMLGNVYMDSMTTSNLTTAFFLNPNSSITDSWFSVCAKVNNSKGRRAVAINAQAINNGCVAPPVSGFSAFQTTTCSGEISFYDSSYNQPNSWIWDFGDGSTSNQQNPIHTYLQEGTYSVQLIVSNNLGVDSSLQVNYITVDFPPGPIGYNDTICSNSSSFILNSSSNNVRWYPDTLGSPAIYIGSPFVTPVLNATTDYYIREFGSSSVFGGPLDYTIGAGNYYQGNHYLIFDSYVSSKIVSALIYADTFNTVTFELRDDNGVVLDDTTLIVVGGPQTIYLDFDVPVANNLQLGINGSNTGLFRNNNGASFPYHIGNIASFTGASNSTTQDNWYFYYNIQMMEICRSEFTQVTAVLTLPIPSPFITQNGNVLSVQNNPLYSYQWYLNGNVINGATTNSYTAILSGSYTLEVSYMGCLSYSDPIMVTSINEKNNNQITFYPNPTSSMININSTNFIEKIYLYDVSSRLIIEKDINSNDCSLNVSQFASGIYFIEVRTSGATIRRELIIANDIK